MIPLSPPSISPGDIEAVTNVLKSDWLAQGPKVKAFELAFSAFLDPADPPYCIAVSSATAGLHLALEAHRPHGPVLVPTWTFTATAEAAHLAGKTILFADVDPVTLNMTGETVAEADIPVAAAAISVHMAGAAAPMPEIQRALGGAPCVHIEDASHALGGTYGDGTFVGAGRNTTVFSFHPNKAITTGTGGMVCTRDKDVADKIRRMRSHGLCASAIEREESGQRIAVAVSRGFRYEMNVIEAALGLAQLGSLPMRIARRTALVERYLNELQDLPIGLPINRRGHAWLYFIIRLPHRDRFMDHMRSHGIQTGTHYVPLHRHPYWRDRYNLKAIDFPGAEAVADRVVTLPLFPEMTEDQQTRVIRAAHAFFE